MTSDFETSAMEQSSKASGVFRALLAWAVASGVDPMQVVLAESSSFGQGGEVIVRYWFEVKH